MPAQIQTEHGLTDIHVEAELHEIDILFKSVSNVEVAIGVSTESSGAVTWSGWLPTTAGTSTIRAPAGLPSGVYHHLKFRSTADNWDMNLQGFLIYGSIEGTKRDGQA